MRLNRIWKSVTTALVAIILLFGVWSPTANAQWRQRRVVVVHRPFFFPHYYYPRTYTVVDPIAYQREQGYSDGLSRGKDDANHGRADDPSSYKHYTNSGSITYREAFAQ